MENRGSRHRGKPFFFLAVEGSAYKHTHPHQGPGVDYFHADFGGADVGIKNRADVADLSRQAFFGIGDETNLRGFAEVHVSEIVFVDVTENPDVGKIGNGEWICTHESL